MVLYCGNVTFCLLIHPHCPTHISTWPMKIVETDNVSICCNGKPINCKLASHKWWKYLQGMLGGLLDCDDIDIVISSVWSRQLLAIKVEHRQSASVSICEHPWEKGVWVKFSKMRFLLFCNHYTFIPHIFCIWAVIYSNISSHRYELVA